MIRYGDLEVRRAAIAELAKRLQQMGEHRLAHKLGHAIDANLEEFTLAPEEIGPVLRVMADMPIADLDRFREFLHESRRVSATGIVSEGPAGGREKRMAANEAFFRELNERLEQQAPDAEVSVVLCECADEDCTQRLRLTHGEYEAVRADPRHFVVVPGHADAEVEEVVARTGQYEIVRKRGLAADVATKLDTSA